MFNGKLKSRIKDGKVHGSIIVVGASGPILISAKERIIGRDVDDAISKVVEQITSAVEFFPLKNLIGEESFVKAIRLYGTLKKGNDSQKRKAIEEMKLVCHNSRNMKDPTSQDIDYALARFARAEQDNKINISGDFMMDAFGFSPANLRKNLNKLADTNPLFSKARELYQMLESGDPAKINEAKRTIKKLYVTLNSTTVSGTQNSAHNILVGVSQFYRAKKMSRVKKQMFGRDDVTMGISFKGIKKGLKKAAKPIKSMAKAAAITITAPVSLPVMMIKKGPKEGAKSFLKANVLTALGPAAVPVLATKKGRQALTDVRKAKSVSPAGKVQAASIANAAQKGDPQARVLLQKMSSAGKAVANVTMLRNMARTGNKDAQKKLTELTLASKTDNKINQMKAQAQQGDPAAKEALQNLKEAEVPEEYLPEEMNDSVVEQEDFQEEPGDEQLEEVYQDEESPEDDLTETVTDVEDMVGFKFSLKPGKKFKAAMSAVKPIAKALTPLAAKAADSFAPGSGVAINAALPSIIDIIPSDRQKDLTMAKLKQGVDMVKAASEMDPKAITNIENIKMLASKGVPSAITQLDALKVAKATQSVVATINSNAASAVLSDRQGGPQSVRKPVPAGSDNIVNVRVVEWGPRKS